MAITYFGSASSPVDNGTQTDAAARTVTPPASMQVGDLVYVVVSDRNTGITITNSVTGGQSWTALGQVASGSQTTRVFWARFNGTWSADPSFESSYKALAYAFTVVMHVFRPTGTSNTWAIDVAQTSGSATPSSPYDVTATGQTALTASTVTLATFFNTWGNAQTFSLQTAGWNVAGSAQYRNLSLGVTSLQTDYKIQTSTGATGNVTTRILESVATFWMVVTFKEITGSSSITVTDVDGDEIITSDQTNVVITGTGFKATQGTGAVTLRQGIAVVTQPVDSWADTSIQVDAEILAVGADVKFGSTTLRVTNSDPVYADFGITVNPPTGQNYVTLTSVATSAPDRITSFPDLAVGDQLWIRGSGGGAAPTGLVVNPDASFYFTAGNPVTSFEVRVWDSSDSTWGDWGSQGFFLTGVVGTGAVGTVNTDVTTPITVTGVLGTTYLADVYSGLDVLPTGLLATSALGNLVFSSGADVEVTGVEAIAQVAKLNIWSTIISSQPTNWVVIST